MPLRKVSPAHPRMNKPSTAGSPLAARPRSLTLLTTIGLAKLVTVGLVLLLVQGCGPGSQIRVGGNNPEHESAPEGVENARHKLASLNLPYSTDAFLAAVDATNTTAVALFIEAGIDVNAPSGDGTVALIKAAAQQNLQMVEILLARGADPNLVLHGGKPQWEGATPLVFAAAGTNLQCLGALLEKGANADVRTANGDTPLMIAIAEGSDHAAKLLIPKTKNLDVTNMAGFTAIDLCFATRKKEIASLLVDAGANPATAKMRGVLAKKFSADLEKAVQRALTSKNWEVAVSPLADGLKELRESGLSESEMAEARKKAESTVEKVITVALLTRTTGQTAHDVKEGQFLKELFTRLVGEINTKELREPRVPAPAIAGLLRSRLYGPSMIVLVSEGPTRLAPMLLSFPYPDARFGRTSKPPSTTSATPNFCGMGLRSDLASLWPVLANLSPQPGKPLTLTATLVTNTLQTGRDFIVDVTHTVGETPLETRLTFYRTSATNCHLAEIATHFPQMFRSNIISALADRYGEPSVSSPATTSGSGESRHLYRWPKSDRAAADMTADSWFVELEFTSQHAHRHVANVNPQNVHDVRVWSEQLPTNPDYDKVTMATLRYTSWWGVTESERRHSIVAETNRAAEKQALASDPTRETLRNNL